VTRPTLSARDIKEAIEDRILRGVYPRGAPLPSVRMLGAELGASPSTVSRALQELEREGWIQVASRRGAVVARRLPDAQAQEPGIETTLRRLAFRWRLSGRDRSGFEAIAGKVADDVFRPESTAYFLECSSVDLARMVEEVRRATTDYRIVPLLIDEVRDDPTLIQDGVVLVPFFHLADVRTFMPADIELVPLNFVPSQDVMRTLALLDDGTHVGVIAQNERSRRRIEGIVHQYSVARAEGTTIDDEEAVERLLRTADVVVTANSAGLSPERLQVAARSLIVNFELERGELDMSSLLARDADTPHAAEVMQP
jgi:DNA-binding transcriptional regulator YhcF (GntR family)